MLLAMAADDKRRSDMQMVRKSSSVQAVVLLTGAFGVDFAPL